MSDSDVTVHRGQCLLVENLADQTQILEHQNLRTVGNRDARRFLPAVL